MEHSQRIIGELSAAVRAGMPSWYWDDAGEARPVMARILLDRRPLGADVEAEWDALPQKELADKVTEYNADYPLDEYEQAARDALKECDIMPRPWNYSDEAEEEAYRESNEWAATHPALYGYLLLRMRARHGLVMSSAIDVGNENFPEIKNRLENLQAASELLDSRDTRPESEIPATNPDSPTVCMMDSLVNEGYRMTQIARFMGGLAMARPNVKQLKEFRDYAVAHPDEYPRRTMQ